MKQAPQPSGPTDEELAKAAEMKKAKEKALADLKDASAGGDVARLEAAIDKAKKAEVASSEVEAAEKALATARAKQEARKKLKAAEDSGSVDSLKAALEEAKVAGLAAAELKSAEDLIAAAESKEKVEVALKTATAERNVHGLKFAIQQAKESGIDAGLIKAAEDVLMVEEPKLQAREQLAEEEVFEDCRDLVQSAADGYNVTMFAYGQTGAGKTFTMYGAKGNEGTAPRTIHEIYRVCEQGSDRFTYTVMGSMLELYCNAIVDLLAKGTVNASKAKLNIRQEKNGTVYMEGLTEEQCSTAEELMALLERGNDQRTVAATAMNSESSRSHLVLLIKIISVNKETKETLKGKMLMCDLAGSERLKKSEVTEHQQKEAIEINRSLTALGDVIEALTKGGKGVVPYRNHKLTQLMQDSLGGT
ncbi:KIN14E, partial [Symbiodinium pilosum]